MAERLNKKAHGGYEIYYRCWKIHFPYWSHNYIYFGSKTDAYSWARRLRKKDKIPYAPKIREIKL